MEPIYLVAVFSFVVTIVWLVIGWRAMIAHETLAKAVSRYVAREEVDRSDEARAEKVTNTKLYKQFIKESPSRADMPARERLEAFRIWCEKKPYAEE